MREWNRRPSGPRNRFSQPDPHLWISVGRVAADAKNYYLTALKCASDQNGSCQISNSFARRIEVLRHLVIYGKGLAFRRLEDELLFLDNAETLCAMSKMIDVNRNGLSCFRGLAFLKWEAYNPVSQIYYSPSLQVVLRRIPLFLARIDPVQGCESSSFCLSLVGIDPEHSFRKLSETSATQQQQQ